jgi:hypothetical protein
MVQALEFGGWGLGLRIQELGFADLGTGNRIKGFGSCV